MDRFYSTIKGLGLLGIHVGALAVFWPGVFAWPALAAAAVVFYATVALGISLCFHRTLTHHSLRLFKPLEYLLASLCARPLRAAILSGTPISQRSASDRARRGTLCARRMVLDDFGHLRAVGNQLSIDVAGQQRVAHVGLSHLPDRRPIYELLVGGAHFVG